MELVLDNIQEVTVNLGEIFIKYQNGSTHFIETDGVLPVKFIRGFRGKPNAPVVVHCPGFMKIITEEPEFMQINQDNPVTKGSTALIRNL